MILLTLVITSAQVVETSVTTTDKNPSQDYTNPDDHTTLTKSMLYVKYPKIGKLNIQSEVD